MRPRLSLTALIAGLFALGACAPSGPGATEQTLAGTALDGCCRNAEFFPPPLAYLADPFAPAIGTLIGNIILRPGYLATDAGQQAVLDSVQPLDVLVLSSKGRLSGNMLPGLFGHFIVYVGSEAELRRIGAWNDPRVVPHQASIRAGARFIESDLKGVHLSTPDKALDTDRAAILRPPFENAAARRDALGRYLGSLGADFDFRFDSGTTDELYCAELVDQVLPGLNMPKRPLYGRVTILPDDVVAEAAVGRARLRLVNYISGTPEGGAQSAGQAALTADLAGWWAAHQIAPTGQPEI